MPRSISRPSCKTSADSGEYLRNQRLRQGLTQAEAAGKCGTTREGYDRWERNEVTPPVGTWPRLIRFLGGYPFPVGAAPAPFVLMVRRTLGLTQFAIGRRIGAIAVDVRKWEKGGVAPDPVRFARLQQQLAKSAGALKV